MSRTSLHTPRPPRAVWLRPATGTRLFPCPFPPTIPHLQHPLQALPQGPSPPPPQRSITVPPGPPDRQWKVPGHCPACPFQRQLPDRRPSHRAQWIPLGASKEPKYPGLRLRAITPLQDYAVVPLGDPLSPGDGSQSPLPPPLRVAERNSPSPDSTVVAFGEAMQHSDGTGAMPPYLRMAGHFWWSRLPHTEIPSRLFHVLSEARGCRKTGVDVEHPLSRTSPFGTGVAALLRNRPGPSIPPPPSPLSTSPVGTTGQSPKVRAPRVGRPHPSPPRKGTADSPYPQLTPHN